MGKIKVASPCRQSALACFHFCAFVFSTRDDRIQDGPNNELENVTLLIQSYASIQSIACMQLGHANSIGSICQTCCLFATNKPRQTSAWSNERQLGSAKTKRGIVGHPTYVLKTVRRLSSNLPSKTIPRFADISQRVPSEARMIGRSENATVRNRGAHWAKALSACSMAWYDWYGFRNKRNETSRHEE